MTRISGSGRPRRTGRAYFIRRTGGECAVIALYPDYCEEVIAGGLTIADAEELCTRKMEALRNAAPALPLAETGPAPAALGKKKHGGRQLVFRF